MNSRRIFILAVAASLIFLGADAILSQGQAADPVIETQNTIIESGPAPLDKEPETQWIYGEAINLDPQNKTIMVKTLDYETDQEKEIIIGTDEKTTFENIKSLDEIKPNDTVSVDYIVTADGKNLAKNISLETPEAQAVPNTVAPEQPQVQTAPTTEAPAAAAETTQVPEAQSSGKLTGN